ANREAKGSDVIYYARKPGEKGFQPLFCRRTSEVESGVFTEDGRFFFAGNYDLWEGGFEADEEGTANIATLVGTRIAPLGVLNTDSANGGSLRVAQIMIAGKFLYVRLDGRHMGELVRLPMPKAQAPTAEGVTDNNDTQRQYAQMSKTLATAQSVPTDGAEVTTAAATLADGVEKLFYRAADNDGKLGLYLWENATGKPQQIAEEPR
ncbi:MAG: hypothetical protein JWO94_3793, partial [Verrucomicrobiaceae bacterium]|nr:hypothetical protein [Verrucomicrobiaceae bacterium]